MRARVYSSHGYVVFFSAHARCERNVCVCVLIAWGVKKNKMPSTKNIDIFQKHVTLRVYLMTFVFKKFRACD
jgi:hypothetical protein